MQLPVPSLIYLGIKKRGQLMEKDNAIYRMSADGRNASQLLHNATSSSPANAVTVESNGQKKFRRKVSPYQL
jgi:hypothetical protein